MVQITARYEGDLRTRATHGPSGATLTTDAPTDNRGRGEAFSPTDLVATAAITCMMTIMGIKATDRGWDLTGLAATVTKIMSDDTPRRIAALEVAVVLPTRLDAAACKVLEGVALACPVLKSLDPAITVRHRFSQAPA